MSLLIARIVCLIVLIAYLLFSIRNRQTRDVINSPYILADDTTAVYLNNSFPEPLHLQPMVTSVGFLMVATEGNGLEAAKMLRDMRVILHVKNDRGEYVEWKPDEPCTNTESSA